MQEMELAYRAVPSYEASPWWWASKRKVCEPISGGKGAFRFVPEMVDPLQLSVLMAALNDYDILEVPLPRSRKVFEATLSPE